MAISTQDLLDEIRHAAWDLTTLGYHVRYSDFDWLRVKLSPTHDGMIVHAKIKRGAYIEAGSGAMRRIKRGSLMTTIIARLASDARAQVYADRRAQEGQFFEIGIENARIAKWTADLEETRRKEREAIGTTEAMDEFTADVAASFGLVL
jgi:hypothetical protein